jgi:hypothetical protein
VVAGVLVFVTIAISANIIRMGIMHSKNDENGHEKAGHSM